jgi:acyl dehydratase
MIMTTVANGIEELTALAGKDLGHTEWRDITQARVNQFADATDDHQWIHTDATKAKDGPFGAPIAHGYLTLSLLIPLFTELLTINGFAMSVNYGLNKVRFPTPVPVGTKIRLRAAVDTVTPVPGNGVEMLLNFTIEIDGNDKPALVAQAVYRHYI